MTESSASFSWVLSIVKLLFVAACLVMLTAAARAYYSDQQLVLAEGGRKTLKDYEGLLTASVKANPWNAGAQLRLADYYYSRGEFDRALDVLKRSSPGLNHWRGWERTGATYEKLAYSELGTEEEIARSTYYYDRMLRVYPSYQVGLERRAVLALKGGEWDLVEKLAASLQELDANNRNSVYMRARAAEALGRSDTAYHLYAQLSAGNTETTGVLFDRAEITRRLEVLEGQDK